MLEISFESPILPTGIFLAIASNLPGSIESSMSVFIKPGAIAFTVIPLDATSKAS